MSEYQVLARKYRPKKLSELIGQDVLVKTISNAITQGRIPHAILLTGIRGVGKTSTARIIARSLLCTGENGENKSPTKEPCGVCANCKSIAADNHVDVLEVDAASRTGVDDIREIIDQVTYAPVMGRYKIYIIDEVHMLSKNAFNALLKTLEEPPATVKFIFATTEVRKIPVTILSRCMRFDLPRVKTELLINHFQKISELENAKVEADALKLIASSAEGSVRDGLSLLDQAIAISDNDSIDYTQVSTMLGLSNRNKLYDLLENIIDKNFEKSLEILQELFALGSEGSVILKDILSLTHDLSLFSISKQMFEKNLLPEAEQQRIAEIIKKTDLPNLTRLYQIFTRSIEETRIITNHMIVAEMAIMKSCYATSLPTPEEILEKIDNNETEINIKPTEKILDNKPEEKQTEENQQGEQSLFEMPDSEPSPEQNSQQEKAQQKEEQDNILNFDTEKKTLI